MIDASKWFHLLQAPAKAQWHKHNADQVSLSHPEVEEIVCGYANIGGLIIHEMSKIACREKVENGERNKKMASTVDCRIKVELSQPSVGSTHSNEIPRRIGKVEWESV